MDKISVMSIEKKNLNYGVGSTHDAGPNELLVNTAYLHDSNQAEFLLKGLAKANLAHAIMLIEQGVINKYDGALLISFLIKCVETNCHDVSVKAEHGDVYNSMEQHLEKNIGNLAGLIHAGRARREAVNLAFLTELKRKLLSFSRRYIELADALVNLSQKHKNSITIDYTYLHHAQPTTLGHYLFTFAQPMLRDFERIESFYSRLDISPAGSGSVNGSSLPLNRERVAELLAFKKISKHARDSMWQPDIPMEAAFLLISSMTNLSRLCEELIIWNSSEFDYVELPDEFCRTSVIMPQKKNPYALAYIRGLSCHVSGLVGEFSTLGRGVSGFPDSRTFIYDTLPMSFVKVEGAISLLSALLNKIKFKSDNMIIRANNSYGFSTDLSDYLIMNYKTDYKTAHSVVGKFVKILAEEKRFLEGNDSLLLQDVAREYYLDISNLGDKELQEIIDPKNIINSRSSLGGASPEQLDNIFKGARKSSSVFANWCKKIDKNLEFADRNLLTQAYKHL